ncbi:MAG: hypothetical protein O7F76_04190 [Planctomycetota bacterium]|nr:hypothetical protein [Planctomycetota bacterium]
MPSRLRRHDEPNQIHFIHFTCFRWLRFFRHDAVKQTFINALFRAGDRFQVRWVGYVIMPEQAVVGVRPIVGKPLPGQIE